MTSFLPCLREGIWLALSLEGLEREAYLCEVVPQSLANV